jgi:hypothetical protein
VFTERRGDAEHNRLAFVEAGPRDDLAIDREVQKRVREEFEVEGRVPHLFPFATGQEALQELGLQRVRGRTLQRRHQLGAVAVVQPSDKGGDDLLNCLQICQPVR